MWYAFATRLVFNPASINKWPRTALEMALPVNIIFLPYSIASEHYVKVEHTDSKCGFLKKKSKIYRLILRNVFFKMTHVHVLQLISAHNCDKNALQNRRDRPVLNKIGYLTIVFSVFSFAKICQCTQFLPHHIYKSIKDITMNFGSLI